MKMENEISSDKAGTVAEIKASKGDTVMEGDVLIVIGE
jgi:biotin carboxyl carrier protein